MKRFHVHVHVDDLSKSIAFYSKLFAAEPTRVEGDYAKWMLDDPRINFAISTRGSAVGIDHLGFQVDDAAELAELKARAEAADMALLDEGRRPAAMPVATSTGSPTRKALRGSISTRSATSRCSAKVSRKRLPLKAPPAAPRARLAASRSALP